MRIFTLIFSILGILMGPVIIFYESNSKTEKIVIACFVSLFALGALITGYIQQNRDSAKSDEIVAYTTGGNTNRPMPLFNFIKQDDNSFQSFIRIQNFGSHPLSNIRFQITESHTVDYNFQKAANIGYGTNWSTAEIEQSNKYRQEHQKETIINGNLVNLPKNTGEGVYEGRIPSYTAGLMYLIVFTWNNQYYRATYQFIYDKTIDNYKILDISIADNRNQSVTDLLEFFPLTPKEFWGDYPTKLDVTPKTYQLDTRQIFNLP